MRENQVLQEVSELTEIMLIKLENCYLASLLYTFKEITSYLNKNPKQYLKNYCFATRNTLKIYNLGSSSLLNMQIT